ncbi:MAG: hypothetical protein ABI843_15120 [Dokdonella sp.]
MQDSLHVTYDRDSDGTGELRASVRANGFSGQGSAWFSDSRLFAFADELLAFPLPSDGLAPLEGGFWHKQKRGELEQLHLSLLVRPIGHRGSVGCRVVLRTPVAQSGNVGDSIDVELVTSYQQLSEFSATFKYLVRGQVQEAVLRGAAG